MKEQYELGGDLNRFIVDYLLVKRPIFNQIISQHTGQKTNLSDKPLQVLAYILYFDYILRKKYPDLTAFRRWQYINSQNGRKKIMRALHFPEMQRINLYMSRLRKMGIISDQGIDNRFLVDFEDTDVRYHIKCNKS